jgi:4-amino-4-deoxy-L-arabinose transferase-like glycosyltransferase
MVLAAGASNLIEKHRLLVLLILAAAGGIAFQGSRGLYEPTEARYAEVAREMLVSGDYLHPTLSDQPHYTKPPLAYWTIAAGMKLFGVNAWGARFGNVFAFILTVLALSELGAAVWGQRAGLIAGLIYVSSPLPVAGAAVVSADTLLALWVVVAMLGFVKAWREESAGVRRWWIRVMWVALAFGFLTKGPPALLPLLVILIYRIIARRKAGLADPLGLALFFVIGFGWYVLMVSERPELLRYFVGEEIFARNLTGSANRNPQWYAPFVIYIPTLFFGAVPWIFFWLRGQKFSFLRSVDGRTNRPFVELPGLITVWWLAIPLLVFFLSKSRLSLYMLQVFPPLALWITAVILRRGSSYRTILVTASVALLVLVVAKGVSGHVHARADASRLFAAVEAAGGPHTSLLLVENAGGHGLEFYSGGEMRRVSVGRRAPWADTTLDAVIAEIKGGPTTRSSTFVVAPSYADVVTSALDEANIAYTPSMVAHHELVVCRGSQ